MIKSLNIRLLPGVLTLIFLLTMTLSQAAMSQEDRPCRQNVLRQASLKWMQVGVQQYKSSQFQDAEQSFRRALVFQKYLTDAERNQLNIHLANTRIAASDAIPAAEVTQSNDESTEQGQPAKEAANEESKKAAQSSLEADRRQIKKMLDKINSQPPRQNVQPAVMAEPSVSNIRLAAESSSGISDIIVTKNEGFHGEYMQLSDWLAANRRNILIIGLPVLAVLIFIMKIQGRKRRPGRRVYENPDFGSSSFIGARLNAGRQNSRKNKFLKKHRPAPVAAANPKRISFTQSTEHWKKNAVKSPAAKPFETNEIWPQRKDKFEDSDVAGAKAEQKQCGRCKQFKPHSEFYKNKSTQDGLARWCKQCKKEYSKKRADKKK